MSNASESSRDNHTRRQVRLVAILHAAEAAGMTPIHISSVHTFAYLADVLAPVWNLPILDAQILKQIHQPFFPKLQADLDTLVGRGVVEAHDFSYRRGTDQMWSLDARYVLNSAFAKPILDTIQSFTEQDNVVDFVREVIYAASGVASSNVSDLGMADATYSDPVVDVGGLLSIKDDDGSVNPTVKVALRLKELTRSIRDVSDSELIHLYVRHLYSRMQVA